MPQFFSAISNWFSRERESDVITTPAVRPLSLEDGINIIEYDASYPPHVREALQRAQSQSYNTSYSNSFNAHFQEYYGAAMQQAATTLTSEMLQRAAQQAGLRGLEPDQEIYQTSYHQPVVLGSEHGVTFSSGLTTTSDNTGSITINNGAYNIDASQYNLWRSGVSYLTADEMQQRYFGYDDKTYTEEEDGNWV